GAERNRSQGGEARARGCLASDQLRELRRADRRRPEETLPAVATFVGDSRAMRLVLYALGDDRQTQRLGHRDDPAQDLEIARVVDDAIDHAAIELQRVKRQALEVAEVAETGAEVVERDA